MQIAACIAKRQNLLLCRSCVFAHRCKSSFLPDRRSIVSGCSLPTSPSLFAWLISSWSEWQGRASSHNFQAFMQLMRKTPDSKSLHASGPEREAITCFAIILYHPNTKAQFKVGRSPFPWWLGAGPTKCLSRAGCGMGAAALQMYLPPAFLSPRAVGTGRAAERENPFSPCPGCSCNSWNLW